MEKFAVKRDPRAKKLRDWRTKGGTRCRCSYCLMGKGSRRMRSSALDRRRAGKVPNTD